MIGGATMKDDHGAGGHLVEKGERLIGHIVAIVLGFVMMVVGVSLGVTIVALPLGISPSASPVSCSSCGESSSAGPKKKA